MTVGGTMYGSPVHGVTSSASSIRTVVAAIAGVDAVNRVALDTPANNADRISAIDFELLKVGNVVLNNQID